MERDTEVKCSLPMIEKRVYRTLIRFEMEVNPITHRGSGKNVPPYQRNCLFVCFFFVSNPCIYCSALLRLK